MHAISTPVLPANIHNTKEDREMEKKQTITNYAEFEHVDFFETALQCYPSYNVHTTASHLKDLRWHKVKTEYGCKIWAKDEDGKYTFHIYKGGNRNRHTLVGLSLEGPDKECNHGCYDIAVGRTLEDMERPNPRQVGMLLGYQSCEGGKLLRDWNLHGEHDQYDLSYWGIKKTLGWVSYITGKQLA